jgi:hypothetical protein
MHRNGLIETTINLDATIQNISGVWHKYNSTSGKYFTKHF